MVIEELEREVKRALERMSNIILRVPKGGLPRSFPRGRLLAEEEIGRRIYRIYRFDPEKILAWIEKRKGEEG